MHLIREDTTDGVKSRLVKTPIRQWVEENYNDSFEAIGQGDSNWQLGTSWANTATGALRWFKWFVNDGGIRVPMIMVTPKNMPLANQGDMTNELASVKDVLMTILDYAGVKHSINTYKGRKIVPPSGVTMKPFLEGQTTQVRNEDQYVAFELL